jgi:hypothetical protein
MQVLIIGLVAYWFAVESGIPNYISNVLFRFGVHKSISSNIDTTVHGKIPIRLYPLDCQKCLGFWLGVIYFPFTIDGLLLSCVSSLIAIVTGLILSKLK